MTRPGAGRSRSAGTGIEIRPLEGAEEFIETEEVSRSAWGFGDLDVSPRTDLVAASHAGGLTAGAFEKGRMLGFVHGIPRVNLPEPAQHSHLLAVRRDAQGRGLSTLLKLFQRRWCLAHGIRLVTWTYDPFLLKNARLNVNRLGGTVGTFLPNLYGGLGGIYSGLPTDRFEVTWRLDSERTRRCARAGSRGITPIAEPRSLPVVKGTRIPAARRLFLPILPGAPAVYRADPAGSLLWRRRFARSVRALFGAGYEVVSVEVAGPGGEPGYVLEPRD